MVIRFTVTYFGYLAQNLASSKVVGCRFFHECTVQSQIFHPPAQKPETNCTDFRRNKPKPRPVSNTYSSRSFSSSSVCSLFAADLLGESSKSPLVVGLISLMRSSSGCSTMNVMGISPLKASSFHPFFQGSKWLPCNEPSIGCSTSTEIDKGGTDTKCSERFVCSEPLSNELKVSKTRWVSKLLNNYSDDAKAAFTALSVSILFKSSLAEPGLIPSAFMSPTLVKGG